MMLATAYGRAAGTGSDPSVLGALETAAGFWSRTFASARVTGAPDVKAAAVTPWMLSTVARSLIRSGESLWLIEVEGGAVRLDPCAYWDVRGQSPNPSTWRIRADRVAPDTSRTDVYSFNRYCLFRYATDPNQPWRGRSPLATARSLSKLASYGEARLADELTSPVGVCCRGRRTRARLTMRAMMTWRSSGRRSRRCVGLWASSRRHAAVMGWEQNTRPEMIGR